MTLHYDELSIACWQVDARFAVHPEFKSHSDGVFILYLKGGDIVSGSIKKNLNTLSSKTEEWVADDDFLTEILLTQHFMTGQGICFQENQLFRDNKNSIFSQKWVDLL